MPPASRTMSAPAATSHGPRRSSKYPSNTPSAVQHRSRLAAPTRRRSSKRWIAAPKAGEYSGNRSLRRNGNPVATIACSGGAVADVRSACRPGTRRPAGPVGAAGGTVRTTSNGACTTPTTGRRPARARPRRRPRRGRARSSRCRRADRRASRCRRARRLLLRRTPGSPSPASRISRTASSLARSASLTQSPGAFSRHVEQRTEVRGDDLTARAARPSARSQQRVEIEFGAAHDRRLQQRFGELGCPCRDDAAAHGRVGGDELGSPCASRTTAPASRHAR